MPLSESLLLVQSSRARFRKPSLHEGFSHTRVAFAVGFIYSISFWKYIKRDPLSSPLGIEAVLETGSVAIACMLALLMLRHASRRKAPQVGLMLMALYGLFTFASAYRSFSPVLSITKSLIFFAVLGICWMMAQADLTWKFLNGIYAGYISITALGLAVGAAFPSRYPLILSEEWTHRNRLSLFDTHPNSVAETCTLMFLLGRVLGGPWRWVPQLLLIVINIFAGEKTSTALIVLIGLGGYLLESRWTPIKTFAICSILGIATVVVTLSAGGVSNLIPERYATQAASSIYGDKVNNELSTMDGRKQVWEKAQDLAMDGVLVGYGVEGAREALLAAVSWSGQAHNGYIEIVLDGGVLGACIFLLGWALLAVAGMRGDRVWLVRAGCIYAMILILAMISPIFDFYSYFSETLVISFAYLAASHVSTRVPSRVFRTPPEALAAGT